MSMAKSWSVSLRFRKPSLEMGFVSQRWNKLLRSVYTLLSLVVCFYAVVLCIAVAAGNLDRDTHPTEEAYFCCVMEFFIDAAMAVLSGLFLVFAKLKWKPEHEDAAMLELTLGHGLILVMVMMAISSSSIISRIMGLDPEVVWPGTYYGSDSTFLLKVLCVLTAAHIGPPMRWCYLLPLQVTAVLLVLINVIIIGSPEPMLRCSVNFALITAMVVATSMAKRHAEMAEREAFTNIIRERTTRCEAEYKLSQSQESCRTCRGADGTEKEVEPSQRLSRSGSDAKESSIPATAASGAIFDPMFEKDVDAVSQLHLIREMGIAEHWLVPAEDVHQLPDDTIGFGSFGVVTKAIFSGILVAVKSPRDPLEGASLQRLPDMSNELRVLRHLRHPNIITIYGAIVSPDERKIVLVLELVHGKTLDKFMEVGSETDAGPELPALFQRYQIMIGVSSALLFMHTRNPPIVHGDLKSANVMVEARGSEVHPKLLDFGMSRIITGSPRPLGGTLLWVAPEVLQKKGTVTCSADIYSFGRLLSYVGTGLRPYLGMQAKQIRWALKQNLPPLPVWPKGCQFKDSLRPLVNSCLRVDQSRRPDTHQVHVRLLALPEELVFQDASVDFLRDVYAMRRQYCPDSMDKKESGRAANLIAQDLQLDRLAFTPVGRTLSTDEKGVRKVPSSATSIVELEDGGLLLYPSRRPTDRKAMAVSLIELVTSWNFPVNGPPCCLLHAGIHGCMQLCTQVLERPCFDGELQLGRQCRNCGMLGLDESGEDCPICRSQQCQPACQQPSLGSPVQLKQTL